ncbi:MAG: hypothetical protein ABJB55_01360 [Actinomycetota bacterium]
MEAIGGLEAIVVDSVDPEAPLSIDLAPVEGVPMVEGNESCVVRHEDG